MVADGKVNFMKIEIIKGIQMKTILLCITTFLFSNNVFTQDEGEWRTIYAFSGSSNEITDDFVIKNPKWRIVWEADKQYQDIEGGNVFIILVDSNGDEKMIANTIPRNTGKTIIRKKGRFYFDISCFLAKWKIEVQEYVNKKGN